MAVVVEAKLLTWIKGTTELIAEEIFVLLLASIEVTFLAVIFSTTASINVLLSMSTSPGVAA